MPKKPKISPEDLAAFQEAMKGVKPITQKKIRITKEKAPSKPIKPRQTDEEIFNLSESDYLQPVQGEEFIAYKQNGISNKTLRKLRKGQYNVDAILDLHGMSVEEARLAVDGFLQQCLRDEIRVALIIHGKGHHSQMPTLKNKLNHWLREISAVLAFCSAAPTHGSRGAIYALLRRKKEEDFS